MIDNHIHCTVRSLRLLCAVWETTEAVMNTDGTVGVSAFDGFQRIGTTRELLSWPGNSGEVHLVKTEGELPLLMRLLFLHFAFSPHGEPFYHLSQERKPRRSRSYGRREQRDVQR